METQIKTAHVFSHQDAPEIKELKGEISKLVSLLSEEDCNEIITMVLSKINVVCKLPHAIVQQE